MITEIPGPVEQGNNNVDPDPELVPDPIPAKQPRNQHLKVEIPKNKQFTGRATESEYNRINKALQLRKRPDQPYDIVRFCLDMMNHIEADFLQTFKTK